MTLKVEPGALKDFAGDMDDLADAAARAVTYAEHTRPKNPDHEAHVFVQFLNNTAEVRPAVIAFFEHLRKLATMSADEVLDAARYYRDTDSAEAERADATYRAVADTPVPTGADR